MSKKGPKDIHIFWGEDGELVDGRVHKRQLACPQFGLCLEVLLYAVDRKNFAVKIILRSRPTAKI